MYQKKKRLNHGTLWNPLFKCGSFASDSFNDAKIYSIIQQIPYLLKQFYEYFYINDFKDETIPTDSVKEFAET